MQEEIWKDIPGFEGHYQVSNLGNVKSLARIVLMKGKYPYMYKGKIMKSYPNNRGYISVDFTYNNKRYTKTVHQLVAMAFLNHKPDGTHKLVVDHINNIKNDNRLENLQILTNRENCSKDTKGSSKYVGVCRDHKRNNWRSTIKINGKSVFLGRYKCELKAHIIYINKLKEINSKSINNK